MKRLIILFSFLAINIWVFALDHSGSISTETWYQSDNPHIITGDISLSSGDTLTIEPGCLIRFNTGLSMTISGVLKAVGTVSDTIVFTSSSSTPAAGDWGRIYFNNPDTGCVMQYCKIVYGGGTAESCLVEISAPNSGGYYNVAIANCYLGRSAGFGIKITKSSLAEIKDCTVNNCSDYPISTNALHIPFIKGDMKFNSNTPNMIKVKGKLNVTTGVWHNVGVPYYVFGDDIVILADNVLTIEPGVEIRFEPGYTRRINVHGGLIAIGTADSVIIFTSDNNPPVPGDWRGINFPESDIISYLTYCDVGYAGAVNNNPDSTNIRLMTSEVVMTNCHIHHSVRTGIIVKGGSHITLVNNKITDNAGVGVDIVKQGGATAGFGSVPSEWNEIYNNGSYQLTNGLHDTYAPYVYWGTTDCSLISDTIFDYMDNSTLGVVNYSLWLDANHNIVSAKSDSWTGAIDSDWNTAGNWSSGNVPCYIMDVDIPGSLTNYPHISSDENCANLTLEPGAEMTVESSGDFKVLGNLEMQANTSGDIASLVNYGDFSVRNNSIVQNYIDAGRWHYLSSPLSSDTAGVFLDMYLYSFDEAVYDTNAAGQTIAGWANITDETSLLTPGTGYKVWSYASNPGSKIVSFTKGSPNDGTVELPTSATDRNGNGTIEGLEGWNLVGNPFPSAIDWDNSGWIGKARFDASIYVFDGTQYLSWNGTKGNLTDGVIPAMQAFFVHSTSTSPLLKVNNNARVSGPSTYKDSEIQNLLKLSVSGNSYQDVTFINFNAEATDGFDSRYDAYKLTGIYAAPQLYSIAGDDILSINVLPEIEGDLSVPLGFEAGAETGYTLSFDGADNFDDNLDIYLEDLKENRIIDISALNNYAFTGSPLDDTKRFMVHFHRTEGDNTFFDEDGLTIYSYDGEILIKSNGDKTTDAVVKIFNISGQIIAAKSINFTGVKKIDFDVNAGFYIVQVQTDSRIHNKQVIVGM